jgi:hypothetical protein
MNSTLKMALAAAAVVAVVVAGVTFLPRDDNGVGGPGGVSPSSALPPSPKVSASPTSSPTDDPAVPTVAGTGRVGTIRLDFTAQLPATWAFHPFGAQRGGEPTGTSFFVSLVDNTFEDPCTHVQRTPKIGSTVEAFATALGEVPMTTATAPVQETFAGYDATYVELTVPPSAPCSPEQFYLWQDSPDNYWWATAPNEVVRVWIIMVDGQRVAVAARVYPETSEELRTELQGVLESMVFTAAP